MHRCYCENINFSETNFHLTNKTEIHHIKNVLRLKKTDQISIFSNNEQEAIVTLTNVSDEVIEFKVLEILDKKDTSNTHIVLACALPKKGKFELIIEKATELGINEIYPLQTKRTEVTLKGDRLIKKQDRFQTVAINAAKQSKRITIPIVHPITNLENCITELKTKNYTLLIPSLENKTKPLADVCQNILPAKKIAYFVGPEGDFTKEEYALASKAGCIPVTLGPTILKVETAAICVASYLRQLTFD